MGLNEFAAALVADRPAGTMAHDLYGPMVGVWDLVVCDIAAEGAVKVSRGEWIFERTLEGAAIQDVFIVPSRAARVEGDWGEAMVRYGMSHRQPRPGSAEWTVDYFGPARGVRCRLEARSVGDEIIQTGVDESGAPYRWVFSEIAADSFLWRNEVWRDGRWVKVGWFEATRREPLQAAPDPIRPA